VIVGDGDPEVSGNGEGMYGAWLDEGKMEVWSTSPLASRSGEEARLEMAWHR
jgi:hypothetical protein